MDIVALKTPKMRGQAFVIFREVSRAKVALKSLQGFPFFGKPMRIQYSKTDSDVIAKKKGTYKKRPKRSEMTLEVDNSKKGRSNDANKTIRGVADPGQPSLQKDNSADQVPNQILNITNLPDYTSEMLLIMLFSQFAGFKEVRFETNRLDNAFVEYDNEIQSAAAKEALQGYKITPTHAMKITFEKKR